jgi:hypothetical protein
MSFIFNVYRLIKSIRSDEVNREAFTFTDSNGREVSYEGHLIHLDMIKRMIDKELLALEEFIKTEIFYGDNIPDDLIPTFNIEDFVDNLQNRSTGYCFIDDPRNNLHTYRHSYGDWLLSDPKRAENFVYMHEGNLVWKPAPSIQLLQKFEQVREHLAPLVALSCGPTTRGREFARMLYRNTTGASRNFMILYHVFALVAIQDKTSHQHLIDRFIPHAPTREWGTALIVNLVLFRPFEEFLVAKFLDADTVDRYRYQLWPGLKKTLMGEKFGDKVGAMNDKYLGKPFRVLKWRTLVSVFASYLPDTLSYQLHKECFLDRANMHGSKTTVAKYSRHTDHFPGSDPRVAVGCLQACAAWHQHVNTGQAHPIAIGIPNTEVERFPSEQEG